MMFVFCVVFVVVVRVGLDFGLCHSAGLVGVWVAWKLV